MRVQRKSRHGVGFTLAETLLAVLILSLVASLMASGIPFAKSAYERVVVGANARLLFYNTVTTLRNELGTAADVEVDKLDGDQNNYKRIRYYSTDTRSNSIIFLYSDKEIAEMGLLPPKAEPDYDPARRKVPNGTIMLQEYTNVTNSTNRQPPRRLVSKSASNKDLYVTCDGFVYHGSTITIQGLRVMDGKSNTSVFPQNASKSDSDSSDASEEPSQEIEINLRVVVGPVTTKQSAAPPTTPQSGGGAGKETPSE